MCFAQMPFFLEILRPGCPDMNQFVRALGTSLGFQLCRLRANLVALGRCAFWGRNRSTGAAAGPPQTEGRTTVRAHARPVLNCFAVSTRNESTSFADCYFNMAEVKIETPSQLTTNRGRKCQNHRCTNKESESSPAFKNCGKCSLPYCSRDCQVVDWKRNAHKNHCAQVSFRI